MKFKPVKTAVIGCGMISNNYLRNIKEKFSILELVGCSDIVEAKSKAQAEKYGIKQMTNEEILNDPEIELVLNLTYATAHFEVSKAILEAGKHCYSEKMIGVTMEEADELDRIRKEKGVMFAVGPDTFLGAGMQSARYFVDSGLIGEVVSVSATLTRDYFMVKSDADDAYRKYSVMAEGGGIPYDMGGYYLHEMFNILGPVKKVCGFATTREQNRPYLNPRHSKFEENYFVNTINSIYASLEFKNGVYGSLNMCSDHREGYDKFLVIGTDGILSVGDPNQFGSKITLIKGGVETELPLYHPYKEESRGIGAAEMAWALRSKREPRLSFEMGYHAFEIINAVIDCTKDGKVKTLKTDFERPVPISIEHYPGQSAERSLYLYK